MPKTQAKRGMSPRELDALRKQFVAEQKQADSASKWQLANDIVSGINDIVGRGVIAPILGMPGDINQAIYDAGAFVNNKIKDVEVATGMVKQPRYVQPSQGNAYLGSEDIGNRMQQAGLVSSERRPMTELAASLVSPSAVAKTAINAPKTAMNMLRMAENLEAPSRGVRNAQGMYIPRGQMGAIDVYHGSPNEFDQFRAMDKIGSGQGGQSFGVGGYHASNKGVASEPQYTGQSGYVYKNQLRWPDAAREAKDPLDTKHFIDWDKPFDEQSDYVKSVISNLNEDDWYRVLDNLGEDGDWSTGRNIYDMARLQFDTKAEASKKLYEAGIAGNVFNDADTINRLGTNTPNYVTFSDELVDVVERNGQPIRRAEAPQAKALREAQINAAKPVSEGGLGLRPDNTPEERAAAMGYTTDAYHGTNKDILSFVPKKYNKGDKKTMLLDIGTHGSLMPETANDYALASQFGERYARGLSSGVDVSDGLSPVVYPLRMNTGSMLDATQPFSDEVVGKILTKGDEYFSSRRRKAVTFKDLYPDSLLQELQPKMGRRKFNEFIQNELGYDSVKYPWAGENVVSLKPENIRSRFAAFDPMRRNSSDLLAGIALPVVAAPVVSESNKKKRKDKKK